MGGWLFLHRKTQKSKKKVELVWGVGASYPKKNQLMSLRKKQNNQSHRENFFFEGSKVLYTE